MKFSGLALIALPVFLISGSSSLFLTPIIGAGVAVGGALGSISAAAMAPIIALGAGLGTVGLLKLGIIKGYLLHSWLARRRSQQQNKPPTHPPIKPRASWRGKREVGEWFTVEEEQRFSEIADNGLEELYSVAEEEFFSEIADNDVNGCAKKLVCDIKARNPKELSEEENLISDLFEPFEDIILSTSKGEYQKASYIGLLKKSKTICNIVYKSCIYDSKTIVQALQKGANTLGGGL